jgi:hypothetical protein
MDVNINYDRTDTTEKKHHFLLPSSIRAIICGRSGCGKTNLMLNFLLNKDLLHYNSVHVYGKTTGQPKYEVLKQFGEGMAEKSGTEYVHFYDNDPLPLDQAPGNSVMVFDDVMSENQNVIGDYFCKGRHSGIDSFYLCQSYYGVPRQLIRNNANLLIFFEQSKKDQRQIYDEFCSVDMPIKEFYSYFNDAVSKPYGFCMIDKDSLAHCGRYRVGCDMFYVPTKFDIK